MNVPSIAMMSDSMFGSVNVVEQESVVLTSCMSTRNAVVRSVMVIQSGVGMSL